MTQRTPDGDKKRKGGKKLNPAIIERRSQVLALRAKGAPPSAIAQQLGVSPRTVHNDLNLALEIKSQEIKESTEKVRALEVEKLDTMERAAWAVMFRKHYTVSPSGAVARHPETREPLVDDAPTLQAIGTLLRLQERRAKLLGLDAAVKSAVEVTTNDGGLVNTEIARLFSELVAAGSRPIDGYPAVQPMAIEGPTGPAATTGGVEDGIPEGG